MPNRKEIEKLQENIVPAAQQNSSDYFPLREGKGPRILFVGNSITKHSPRPSIGWYRDCGMAASDEAHDYVHLMMEKILSVCPDAAFAILQVANYERGFADFDFSAYASPKAFAPDVAIFFFGANVAHEYESDPAPKKTFFAAVEDLRNFLSTGKTAFFLSDGFYIREKLDDEKRAVAEKYGDVSIRLENSFREDPAMHGEFNHPSDAGMQYLADRFFDVVKPLLKKF